jgi:serine/threonine-protein kinase
MDNKLPHYSRERLLGEGGMGKVYLAQDNQLQRQVAIKELTYQPKEEEVNHALQEARLLARVNHSNIIQIYNVHDEGDHISLVMEYFNSKTLTQFQQEAYTTLVQKLDLLQQLSAGLAAAHKNDVIHCDLKPSNILVNDQGHLKITDFGIALLATNENQNSEPSASNPLQFGSLLFMSPEQIKLQAVDYRSDIFSLGIIAYQLMVGSHPFAYGNSGGSATDVAKRICEHTPEHAKNLMLNAPSALTDLLMEMLVKPLEQRILTAEAIENRLKHIRTALLQAQISEEETLPLAGFPLPSVTSNEYAQDEKTTPVQQSVLNSQSNQNLLASDNPATQWLKLSFTKVAILALLCLTVFLALWFNSTQEVETKQVVILKPTLVDSSLMAPMQQDLVISAVEDALRQAVINTKNMYLISQREVNAISKEYPDDLNKLRQAVGASDIISTTLECDNSRCKVSFSRLVVNENNSDNLSVKSEKNWLAPIDKFNVIFSTSQTQFASLFPEQTEVNQSGLIQRPINEGDYRDYIALYSQIKGQGNYNSGSLSQLKTLLTRSPYLYAGYGLYRDTALDLYLDSKDKKYFRQLDVLLQNSPPEYRYSVFSAIDRFWLASDRGDMIEARIQVGEAQKRGADDLTILGFEAFMFFNNGNYEEAADSYANAFKLRPSSSLLYNVAFSYWRMGDLTKAEDSLNKMLKVVPNDYKAIRLQANIWLLQGRLKLAISAFEKIVTNLNKSKDISNLSLAYGLNNQYEKSLDFAQKALKQNPKQPINLLNLADIEMILGNEESAISHYQQVVAILIGKNEVKYLTNLAQAYGQLNKANLAIEALSKAQALAPKNGEVSYSSAIVYSLLKEEASAVHHVKAALKNNVGAVWFNLPWFDSLCREHEFQQLMLNYNNATRCSS